MIDFQSIDALVPPRSKWLPGERVIDGHRIWMTEDPDTGELTIHDEPAATGAGRTTRHYWADDAAEKLDTGRVARVLVSNVPRLPERLHPDPLIRRARLLRGDN